MKKKTPDFGVIGACCVFLDNTSGMYYYDRARVIECAGFERIGSGCYRDAYVHAAVPGVVFKVAQSVYDSYMGEGEYAFYHSVSKHERKYLAECYHVQGSVCVMEHIKGHHPRWKNSRDFFNQRGVCKGRSEYSDMHTHNMIRRGKKLIAIDYAVN